VRHTEVALGVRLHTPTPSRLWSGAGCRLTQVGISNPPQSGVSPDFDRKSSAEKTVIHGGWPVGVPSIV